VDAPAPGRNRALLSGVRASGIYFLRLTQSGREAHAKFVVLAAP
jgi:hypothetical protein